ncbi:MAG TPA: hypothetical protein VK446_12420 [Methylocystis sp.]|nr:hypothetical protein [Methylocystis sp.]
MLFNVEADRGDHIVGYLVPDDYTKSPTLKIMDDGGNFTQLHCVEERPALVLAGRHANGRCGFTVDTGVLPGLSQEHRIELYDADTGVMIYRRRELSEVTQQRIFRLETHLFPLWRLDETVEPKFQFFHKGVERHGRETALQIMQLNNASSIYVSGRLAFRSYENFLHDQFRLVTLIHDPYCELAERLLTLKHSAQFGDKLLGPRDFVSYRAAIEFAQGIEPDRKSLRRAFDQMSKEAIGVLTNPLTRQLTAEQINDPPPKGAVAKALQALSAFAIVGVRPQQEIFLEDLETLMGEPRGVLPTLPVFSKMTALAEELRILPEAEILLEQDLDVFLTVKSAVEEAA